MRAALAALFNTLLTVFVTVDRAVKAVDNIAIWAEGETDFFNKEAAIEREDKIKQLEDKITARNLARQMAAQEEVS